jgi:hypothetical protein
MNLFGLGRNRVKFFFGLTAIIVISSSLLSAQEIRIKRTLIRGYYFSADSGNTYQPVGNSARELQEFIGGDERIDLLLDRYRARKMVAQMTAYLAGACVLGGLLIGAMTEGEGNEATSRRWRWRGFIMGIPCAAASAFSRHSARGNLLEAVQIHNENQMKLGISIEMRKPALASEPTMGAMLSLSF